MVRVRIGALLALAAALASELRAAARIELDDASAAASSTTTSREAKYAVNGAGLRNDRHTNSADFVTWSSATQSATVSGQWFRVDLGRQVALHHFKIWNCNYWSASSTTTNRGIREAEVYLSNLDTVPGTNFSDAAQWTRVIDKVTFARAPGSNAYTGEPDVSLLGRSGRWLALRVLSNFNSTEMRVSLSELQVFEEELPIAACVPADVTAADAGPSAARVSWSASTNAAVAGYRVYRDGVALGASDAASFDDPGPLDPYRSYEYAVCAVDASTNFSKRSSACVYAYRRFPFAMPWDDAETNSVADMSGLTSGPADTWVTATNGRLQAGAAPVRFLGVNMVFGAAFPEHAAAEALAQRLDKLGVNCVRFHHIDNSAAPRGIFTNVASSSPLYLRTLDPGQVDKLDYFIAQLKARGIYANVNLHVSRSYPGFPTNGAPSYFKGVDHFMPGMVDLQREYARDLLTHVNPYTGNAYVQEPAIALVEVNNENGLIYEWLRGTFGPALHTNYLAELSARWNAWLADAYTDTAALSAAWSPAAAQSYGRELLTNGTFASALGAPWELAVAAPAAAAAQTVAGAAPGGGNALQVNVTAAAGPDAVRLSQTGLAVTAGQPYTVAFWARASGPVEATAGFAQSGPPGLTLASATVALAEEWRKFTLVLQPGATEPDARFDVTGLGAQAGTVWLAGLSAVTGNALLGPSSASAEGSVGAELLTNGNLSVAFASPWSFQVVAPAGATRQIATNAAPDGSNALLVNVTTNDAVTWHVQYYQTGLHVTNGQPYTATFWAKTEFPRSLALNLMQQNDPYGGLASATVALSTNWQFHTVVLTPVATEYAARMSMSGLASQTGKVWFAAHSLRAGVPGAGLLAGEALGQVGLIANKTDYALRARAVQRDWMRFLWDTEAGYWAGMRDYLRDTLGSRSLLIGTQASYSPTLMQALFDVVDSHAYWQHPSFPNKPWDSSDYTVKNLPMTSDTAGGTIPGRAQARVAGKPFVCTEFNHPAPLTYTAEALPLNAAYAALQQWDGLFAFQYMQDTNWDRGYISDFFSMAREPAKLISYPFAAAALRGAVSAAAGEARSTVPLELALARIAQTDAALGVVDFGVESRLALQERLCLATGAVAVVCAPWRDTGATAVSSDTGELAWDMTQRVVTVRAARAKALVGDTGGKTYDLGDGVRVTPGVTLQRDGWCALTLLVREGPGFRGSGSRILLTAAGYADNHRQLWSSGMGPTNATSMVAAANWGSAPTLMEAIEATVELELPAAAVSVWALDERGRRKGAVPVEADGERARFALGGAYRTAWYELQTLPPRRLRCCVFQLL